MWPSFSLFQLADVYTLPLFCAVAVFFAAFIFWRLLHQSARYNEFEIFDALIWSTLAGLVFGRLFHIALNYTQFTLSPLDWFNFVRHPGLSVTAALAGTAFVFWRYLLHLKIHDLELLDYWVRGVCLALFVYNIGLFCDGSGSGYLTTFPLSLRFPDSTFRVVPAQTFSALFFLALYFLLAYLEKNYRTYSWYRGTRSQAKSGFVLFAFWLAYATYRLLSINWTPATYHLFGFDLDWIFYLILILACFILLYRHALAIQRPKKSKNQLKKVKKEKNG